MLSSSSSSSSSSPLSDLSTLQKKRLQRKPFLFLSKMYRVIHLIRNLSLRCRTLSSSSSMKKKESIVNESIKRLFRERDLEILTKKFKKASEDPIFRCRYSIYENTVRRLASAKKFDWIQDIIEEQKKYVDSSNEGFVVRLISLYGKAGMAEQARKMFVEMPVLNCPRTVKSLNAVLTAYVESKKFDQVDGILTELQSELSVEANIFTYNILIQCLCEMGSLDKVFSLLDTMESKSIKPDLITYNILLNGFYRKNRFIDAEKIWAIMEKNYTPDVYSYNAKLKGLVAGREITDAILLFDDMRSKGCEPNVYSYNILIKGFCDKEDMEQAEKIYSQLEERGCAPSRQTFEPLIMCAIKKDNLDLASKFIKRSLVKYKKLVNLEIVQSVVDGLMKDSEIEEAKELVKTCYSKGYSPSKLKLVLPDMA